MPRARRRFRISGAPSGRVITRLLPPSMHILRRTRRLHRNFKVPTLLRRSEPRPRKPGAFGCRGVTMIELVMTILVTAVVSVPLIFLVAQIYESSFQSSDITIANLLAEHRLAVVRNTAFASISSATLSNYLS